MTDMTHQDFIINEMHKEIDRLFSTFDTKLLATLMLNRSAQALRAVHSAKLWTVEDVKAVVGGALEDIYVPLSPDKTPKVGIVGGVGGGNTLQ